MFQNNAEFCPVVPEICRGQVRVPRKERRIIIIIIIRRNGAKTISLQMLFGRLNYLVDFIQYIITIYGQYINTHDIQMLPSLVYCIFKIC